MLCIGYGEAKTGGILFADANPPSGADFVPWDISMQHGSAPAALVVWAAEAIPAREPMRIARVTIDLMRPVPVVPLTIETKAGWTESSTGVERAV
jgi:hypothetical protein